MPAPTIIQQASSASTVAAPASFTTAAFTATQVGSSIVIITALACSGVPSMGVYGNAGVQGTTNLVVSPGNTIGIRAGIFSNNPGGLTTLTFGGLVNVNGIAVAVYELANVQAGTLLSQVTFNGGTAVNSSTTCGPTSTTINATNEAYIGAECDLTGQAFTNTSSSLFTAGTTATSTTGATNTIIRPFSALPGGALPPGGTGLTLGGTLAGALANATILLSILSTSSATLATGPGGQVLVSGGAGYGVGV